MDTTKLQEKLRARRALPPPEECRAIRERAGATQEDLADAIGTHRECVSRWERGVRRPRGRLLFDYLAVLNELRDGGP
jgi:DNA-binding transcriptional regulator YiaG